MHYLMAKAKSARALFNDRRGVTAMEYGLIAALVAVAIIVVIGNVGTQLETTFKKIETALETANK